MLSIGEVSEVALRVVEHHLPHLVERLAVSKVQNSSGEDAWRVEVILQPAALDHSHLNDRAEALTELQWRLGELGEPLFAYLSFTSEGELAELAGE